MGPADDRFAALAAALVRDPERPTDLAEAALLVAADFRPGLDVGEWLARLDALAESARPTVLSAWSDAARVAALNEFLFVKEGFAGNTERYEDPANSLLSDVLERKTGIPITLSLVLVEVARRTGLPLRGVSFPGHFLVKLEEPKLRVLDAFHGRILELSDCRARLHAALGQDVVFRPDLHLRAATPREILVRMLTNLKHLYLRARDFGRTLACCERILLLLPDTPLELRDRGLVYERLECFAAAAHDLERFLQLAPDDESAPAIRERLRALRAGPHRLH